MSFPLPARALLWTTLTLATAPAGAKEPLWRWVTTDEGLRSEHTRSLAQGSDGLVWIGTSAGVHRFDGRRAEPWDGGRIRGGVDAIVPLDATRGLVLDQRGQLWLAEADATTPMNGPRGTPMTARWLASDGTGGALVLREETLWRWRDGLGWQIAWQGEALRGVGVVRPCRDGFIVGRYNDRWRVLRRGMPALDIGFVRRWPIDAREMPDGSIWTLDSSARLVHVRADGTRLREMEERLRGMGLAIRGGDLWAAMDERLVRIRGDEVRRWGREAGFVSGGPLLVDHEGSVWLGTHHGVGHLAEPEAGTWGLASGLPGGGVRSMHRAEDRVWVGGWGGIGFIDIASDTAHTPLKPRSAKGFTCADAQGRSWVLETLHDRRIQLVRFDEGEAARAYPTSLTAGWTHGCARSAQGHVWWALDDVLMRTVDEGPPERVTTLPTPDTRRGYVQVYEADGRLWVSHGEHVCETAVAGLDDPEPTWSCTPMPPDTLSVHDMVLTEKGTLWVTSVLGGLYALQDGRFEVPAGVEALPSYNLYGVSRSPRGGQWIGGAGVLVRVVEREDAPGGWRVEERLDQWLGHLISSARVILEDDDGTLWVGSGNGVAEVPASARVPPTAAPAVSLLTARVDGRPQAGPTLTLPDRGSQVQVEFVASSFRAPALLRYRRRIDGQPWGPPMRDAAFEVQGLGPGAHTIEVAASLDGEHWTEPPARITLLVPVSWYGRIELWGLVGILLAGAAFAAWRIRFLVQLRTERLRTRIAMDLHDEVGSGLGAINLMSGLLRRGALPSDTQVEIGEELTSTVGSLQGSLRGIVWSLRPTSQNVGALGAYLADIAARAVPREAALHLALPDPTNDTPIDLETLRAVQLIALEALHNAAKHAQPEEVWVALDRVDSTSWRLRISDDGPGLGGRVNPAADQGLGLEGMRRRAEAVSARLGLYDRPGGGTTVELVFRTRTPFWRPR